MPLAADAQLKRRYQFISEAKADGATYTPAILADFIADKIIGSAVLPARTIRLLDPAVGDGELLVSILRRITSQSNTPVSVYGFDTNEKAVAQASQRLGSAFPKAELHLEHGSFLNFVLELPSADRTRSLFEAPAMAQDFDIIIANPPYVRTQIMGSHEAQKLGGAFGLSGRVDLYHAF